VGETTFTAVYSANFGIGDPRGEDGTVLNPLRESGSGNTSIRAGIESGMRWRGGGRGAWTGGG
jgi:hypothetical protein